MSFVKKVIGPDETLIGISSAHWIYGAKGIAWLAGMMILGLVLSYYINGLFDHLFRNNAAFAADKIGDIFFWLPTLLGLVMFFTYVLVMISPEIALTNKRIIYKKGIIAVDVKELDLEEIKAVDVDNGTFGRFLNYGYIVFDARFVGNLDLPAIAKPYRFVKALNEARSGKNPDMQMVQPQAHPEPQPEQRAQPEPKQQSPKPEQTPQLTSARYNDPSDVAPRHAVHQVLSEMSENTKRALNPDMPPETAKKERRPTLFNTAIVKRAKRLRKKIKDSFAAKAA